MTAVSQTGGPETVLAGEAEIPYALIGYATDYANGVKDEATPVVGAHAPHRRVDRDVRDDARGGGAGGGERGARAGRHALPF